MIAALLVVPTPTTGQAAQGVTLEAGVARTFPPSGVDEATGVYGTAGVRIEVGGPTRSGWAVLTRGFETAGGGADFLTGLTGIEAWFAAAGPVEVGLAARGYGFRVAEPFPYQAITGEVSPMVRISHRRVTGRLRGRLGAGRTEVRLRRGDEVRTRTVDLWRRGVDAEVSVVDGAVEASAGAGVHSSRGGTFRRAGLRLTGLLARVIVQGEVEGWETPDGNAWAGGLAVRVPLGDRWSALLGGGTTAPDPLTLVEPGRQGGVVLGWQGLTWGNAPRPVARVQPSADGPRVVFRLDRGNAESAAVLGDFTNWEPVPMRRTSGGWTTELSVPPGTYHFGFLIDGEWVVPEGLPGNVPDEWGRTNATLVVP